MIRQSKFSKNQPWTNILWKNHKRFAPVVSCGANDPSWNADAAAKITAAGYWSSCDIVNVSVNTPSLSDLQRYKAVLIYNDGGFADSVTLGNNLADYVDAGYGVVLATFDEDPGINLQGRWASGGYDCLTIDGQGGGPDLTIGEGISGHPLLDGVTTFDGGQSSYYNTGTPTTNTTVIAAWSNAAPLVIEKTGFNGKIVMLNFYPPSSDARSDFWVSSTQGGLLMSNALKYVQKT